MKQPQARLLLFKSYILKLIIDYNAVAKVTQGLYEGKNNLMKSLKLSNSLGVIGVIASG